MTEVVVIKCPACGHVTPLASLLPDSTELGADLAAGSATIGASVTVPQGYDCPGCGHHVPDVSAITITVTAPV